MTSLEKQKYQSSPKFSLTENIFFAFVLLSLNNVLIAVSAMYFIPLYKHEKPDFDLKLCA